MNDPGLFARLAATGRLIVRPETGLVSVPTDPFPTAPPLINCQCWSCGHWIVGLPRDRARICDPCYAGPRE